MTVTTRSRASSSEVGVRGTSRPRPAPKAAQVIVPVWGAAYVQQFLQFGLPTMLSPGNLPAIARQLTCRLVVLSSSDDYRSITRSPVVSRAETLGVAVEVRTIDHLITSGNHSTTITLASTEAILSSAEAMLDTCFFLGVSDYIYADGSLCSVLRRMTSGRSAVLVGNFQVIREKALPSLRQFLEHSGQAPAFQPRELMAWALVYLHPATVANTVNIPYNHNAHTNRLFWKVDGSTLLGRFFLRHPICIRPETREFQIGSSLDYSFVPEMCPSGNVTSITDSDEYLVIEVQPGGHETDLLRYGSLRPKVLAKSLEGWTTRDHRLNVSDVHVYHSRDVPDSFDEVKEQSDAFVGAVLRRLRRAPLPERGHPYWKGAIAAFSETRPSGFESRSLENVYGMEQMSGLARLWWRRQYLLFGRPPKVRAWDPNYPDFATALEEVNDALKAPGSRVLLVADQPTTFTVALSDGTSRVEKARAQSFLRNPPLSAESLGGLFDACLIEVGEHELASARRIISRASRCLLPGGHVILLTRLTHDTAPLLANLELTGLAVSRVRLVPRTLAKQQLARASRVLHHLLYGQPWFGLPLAVVLGPPVVALSALVNLSAKRASHRPGRAAQSYSSAVVVLEARPQGVGSGSSEDRIEEGELRIAVDLDNTIVCFDEAFVEAARAIGLVGPEFQGGKQEVRDLARRSERGDVLWSELQGEVYGTKMQHAQLYPGVADFLRSCRNYGAKVWIVSHKTEFNQFGQRRVNLRDAALDWMNENGFFDIIGFGFSREEVYFEKTRDEKLARLRSLRPTHVVDDLVEVLTDPSFPVGPRRILYDPSCDPGGSTLFVPCSSWQDVEREIFGGLSAEAHGRDADMRVVAS